MLSRFTLSPRCLLRRIPLTADYRGLPLFCQNFAPGCGSSTNYTMAGFVRDFRTSRQPDPTHKSPPNLYQWRSFARYDAAWAALAEHETRREAAEARRSSTQHNGGTEPRATWQPLRILNVSSATGYRVDGHCGDCQHAGGDDCLHYCLPGAVDLWSVALQDALGVSPLV